jgi:hypothetical protein
LGGDEWEEENVWMSYQTSHDVIFADLSQGFADLSQVKNALQMPTFVPTKTKNNIPLPSLQNLVLGRNRPHG